MRSPDPSQKTEGKLADLPRRDSQPQTAYQVVAVKNLFSVHRRSKAPVVTGQPQKNDFDQNILQGIIVVGRERAALLASKDSPAKNKVEIVRQGETWNGYKVLEIGPETVTFQAKEGRKTMVFPEPKAKTGIVTRIE
jgi:hypothetical protein